MSDFHHRAGRLKVESFFYTLNPEGNNMNKIVPRKVTRSESKDGKVRHVYIAVDDGLIHWEWDMGRDYIVITHPRGNPFGDRIDGDHLDHFVAKFEELWGNATPIGEGS
jgi:hypothetical protein